MRSPSVKLITQPTTTPSGIAHLLTCSITLASELIQGTSLQSMWTLANSVSIMGEERLADYASILINNRLSFTYFLIISNLLPSDGGIYNCTARVNSTVPYLLSSNYENSISHVTVQGMQHKNYSFNYYSCPHYI